VSTGKSPALSYNVQHHQVRLELTRGAALDSPRPSPDLVQRAMAKLEKVQGEGKINFYEIYEERLAAVWKALRDAEGESDDLSVSFLFAAGAPTIDGLEISYFDENRRGLMVTTTGPMDLKKISIEWIRNTIAKVARQHGIFETLFQPHVQSALMRITAGDTLSKFIIESRAEMPKFQSTGKPYSVFANKNRVEVVAYIRELPSMQSDPAIDRMCELIGKAIDKIQSSGSPDMLLTKTDMASTIRSAISGPERVGLGMPLAVLAALPDLSKLIGKKFLSFVTSNDRMLASIADFDVSVYDDPEFDISREFMEKQMRLSDLRGQVTDQDLNAFIEAANKRENLDGKVAGRGKQPESGADPYIHLVFKDAPKQTNDQDFINIRESQQRSIVHAGQLVAEIRYAKPEVIGMDIFGKPIQPSPGPAMEVVCGEGIQQLQPGKFYAECGGVPSCEEGNKLNLTKSHVHEGDVNLKSGNIYFDGPVEIKGSVDCGALVRVKGPLKVYGSIVGGTVISKDPIEVVESIVTGTQGKVICSTHIKADFIENSNIECDGSIVVNKSLVSSEVVAGDYIQALAPDGVIGGGTIMCRDLVAAANIGFAKGAKTRFIVGVDHRVVRRTKIREKRLQNLLEAQERYKLEFRELAQKKEGQLTAKHKQLKESLKEKMASVRPIIEVATQQLELMKSSMTYNEDAMIAATNVFAANCQVEVGGQGVVMEADTMAVGISARKRRDSHLCTYDEIKSEIDKKLAGGAAPAAAAPVSDAPAELSADSVQPQSDISTSATEVSTESDQPQPDVPAAADTQKAS